MLTHRTSDLQLIRCHSYSHDVRETELCFNCCNKLVSQMWFDSNVPKFSAEANDVCHV